MVNEGDRLKWEWRKAGVLATIVLAVTAVSCGPYILAGQFFQVKLAYKCYILPVVN